MNLLAWCWTALPAFASVEVDDPVGCLDSDRVDNELRLQLGDPTVERLVIRIQTAAPLVVRTTVREDDETLWSRETPFEAADCPMVPEAIALSVQQGLAMLPGWSFGPTEQAPLLSPTVTLAASVGIPTDLRFGIHPGMRIRLTGPLSLWTQARIQTGPPFEIGQGAATIVHPAIAVGPAVRAATALAPEGWLLATGGAVIAFGSRFDRDKVALLPRSALELGGSLGVGRPLRLGAYTELPIARFRLVENSGAGRTEPAIRLGLTLGIDFSSVK